MGRYVRGLVWMVATLAAFGALVRAFLLEGFVVPDDPKTSASVAPTMAGGDVVLFMKRNKPAFGDLVRCTDPQDPTGFVIGRVVGLTGDVVETDGRELTVNNMRYVGEMACAKPKYTVQHPSAGSDVEIYCDQVQIAGHPHMRGSSVKAGIFLPTKTTVGEGMLYLLSDDRSYHDDSRDFGTVPATSCSGRIVFRVVGKGGWADDQRRMTFIQ